MSPVDLAAIGTGVCPACGAEIDGAKLLCPRDWRRLPRSQRNAVYRAWDRYQTGEISTAVLREVQEAAVRSLPSAERAS